MGTMANLKIDYSYISGYPYEYWEREKEVLPSAYAIYWCMTATGMYRIFSREDMKEFLFRLAIVLNSKRILETWLAEEELLRFSLRDKAYVLLAEDIALHFGIEIIDAVENCCQREQFLQKVSDFIWNATFSGLFAELLVIEAVVTGENEKKISVKEHTPEITPELIEKAEFFSNDLMSFIPNEVFTAVNPERIRKKEEILQRRERIKSLPVFDIRRIPDEVLRECLEIFYIEEYALHLLESPEDFEKFGTPLIYLAWLDANNLLKFDDGFVDAAEGFYIDLRNYELEDGGSNLLQTIEMYNMAETKPLLKGLLI